MEHDLNPSEGRRARLLAQTLVQEANLGEEGIVVAMAALQIAVLDVVSTFDQSGIGMEVFIGDLRVLMAEVQTRPVPWNNLH